LKALGYAPEIVVAPENHAVWEKRAGGAFATPRFDNIGELAAYLYESSVVVANDSGNGHLASFLGIPVVTVYRKKNPLFHWRPDWKPGIVVCPSLPWQKMWKYLVRPSQVVAAIERLQRSPD
jgi:ADP-heptose:LPS heptosyltransferase